MTTMPTTETEPAQEPFVRFAAFRGKVPLPWVTVFALAIVMAAADGFILTSLQVFDVAGGLIRYCVTFADPSVFGLFDLPPAVPDRARRTGHS